MSDSMTVTHLGADRFAVEIRGHTITVDQPVEAGGADTAPTPTELFVASLASCVAFYARRYLARHDVPTDGLSVTSSYTAGGKPNRVTDIAIRITPPAGLPAERHAAFLAVASHCTVHNTLHEPPAAEMSLGAGEFT
jgi:putative redox protein